MASTQHKDDGKAPWVLVPDYDITSIEHPCIVKNMVKGIDMLGGAQRLAHSLEQGTQQCLSLTFNPSDPASRTITSLHNDTYNVLLKVTVPKRTGRKRKRGSNDEFVEDLTMPPNQQDASHLLKSLRDNPDSSNVEAIGNIKSCHLWRTIPDFTYHTKASGFLQGIETHLLPQQYSRLKAWSMPQTYGLENTEVVPPPVFSTQGFSQNYTYRQNPAVKTFADPNTGNKMLINRSAPVKLHVQTQMYDDDKYPDMPSPNCPPLEDQSQHIRDLVAMLQALFNQRPIWTKRALMNSLPSNAHSQLIRFAAPYVCYSLRSGPWRDAYVKLGIDPRNDSSYRKYQTILLKLAPKDKKSLQTSTPGDATRLWNHWPDKESHIFTGTKTVPIDGKTWQICDLYDPDLKSLVDLPDLHIRAECEIRYFGWYQNGTSAKLRVLLKAKIDALTTQTELEPAIVESFLQLPENWSPITKFDSGSGPMTGYLPEKSSNKALEWAAAYRSICRTSVGGFANYNSSGVGWSSKQRPTARPDYISSGRETDEEGLCNEYSQVDREVQQDAEAAVEYEEPEVEHEELEAENADSMVLGIGSHGHTNIHLHGRQNSD